jgi:transposase
MAQEATRIDYLHEVEHMRERVAQLEQATAEAVKLASPALQQVINDLQALRGIADISAVTIAAELGQVTRYNGARQLMGYCGAAPSEDSSGKRTRRGSNALIEPSRWIYVFGRWTKNRLLGQVASPFR